MNNLKKYALTIGAAVASILSFSAEAQTIENGGWFLTPGQNIGSQDGRFVLELRADRNLVLRQGGTQLWQAKTNITGCTTPPGASQCIPPQIQNVTFQTDGNLVAYDQFGHGWGISNTYHSPNAILNLQNDGNLVIYDTSNRAVWSTKTCCH